jgi:hypothetical protein
VHSVQRACGEGVPDGMLRGSRLLRDIATGHRASAAPDKIEFRTTEHRGACFNGRSPAAKSASDRTVCFLQRKMQRAFAAAARAHLHPSHLI